MIYVVGITITFFLVFILINKKNKSTADTILTAWLSITGLHLLLYHIYASAKYVTFPFFLGLEIPLPLLHGPFLYLYTVALTNQQHKKKINILHFIPFALALLSLFPFLVLPFSQKIKVYQEEGKSYELLNSVIFIAIILSGIFYTIMSLRKLEKHRKAIGEQFSSTEKINLKWLSYLILGLSVIWVLVFFRIDKYIFSAVVFYVLFIGYFGIKQVDIFTDIVSQIPDENEIDVQPEKIKYEKSKISTDEVNSIYQKLSVLMQIEKIYTDPELTLPYLAQKINVHPNTLSQIINSVEQKNFYDYINHQRVEEFKRLIPLSENQKFTLLSLAFECGFNSKTAFNRNFKKATNLSPTEYLKQANINLV